MGPGDLNELAAALIAPLLDPGKRIFVGWLALTLPLGLAWLAWQGRGRPVRRFASALAALFTPRVWWSRSARADYLLVLVNRGVGLGLFSRLLAPLTLATVLFEALHGLFAGRPSLWPDLPAPAVAMLFTACFFVLDDAARYLLHRALHRVPFLWAFHKVHHSARTLTPFTVYRTHPVEGLLFALRGIVVQAVAIAGFVFFFADRADLVTVLGANLFTAAFNIAGANLRHSHVAIRYGRRLEHVLISPAQHQIHHSLDPAHHDRNFGAALAIWDLLGGSLCLSRSRQRLRFGLDRTRAPDEQALAALLLRPFAEAARSLSAPWRNRDRRPPRTRSAPLATRPAA